MQESRAYPDSAETGCALACRFGGFDAPVEKLMRGTSSMVQPPTFPPRLIQCPKCGKPSDCIKRFKMLDLVVFVGIFAWARRATYTACAGCMRKIIAQRMIINLFTANLIWPIIVFSWIGKMIATYSKGHSAAVLEEIARRQSIP